MIADKKQNKIIFWSFLSLYMYSFILELPNAKIAISSFSFFFLLYISIFCLLVLYWKTPWKKNIPRSALAVFNLILICNTIAILRAVLTASTYFDWKSALIDSGSGLSLLIPLAMLAGVNFLNSKYFLRLCVFILGYSFLYVPLFYNYTNEIYARLVTPVVFLILLIPYYKLKQQTIIIVIGLISAYVALTWRANVVHIGLSFSFLLVYIFRKWLSTRILFIIQIAFFVIPFYYLYEGIQGNSIFAKNEDKEIMVSQNTDDNLTADTRTDLYAEVLTDLTKTNDIWLGRGANGKYKTVHDWELIAELGDERPNVEVGFLKILIQTGIAGLLIYIIILALAIFYGTAKTNNTFTKMCALFLASHWTVLFLENSIDYNIYFYLSWLAVGICYSSEVRNLNDEQLKRWLRYNR